MANENFELFDDRVLVKPNAAEEKTAGGIIIPDTAKEKPQKGKVIAVGGAIYQDSRKVAAPAKLKDVVLYKKWGGNEVKIGNIEYMFVKFEDILAIEG